MFRRGFTLIEIVIVITILGIIAAIVIPQIVGEREKDNKRTMNLLKKTTQVQPYKEDSQMEPGVYQIWVEECGKFITITISDSGG